MGINDWDDKVWSKQWDSVSVLVMTHQVLLNALRAGRARLADIDLLIFDECHHARGNHPYALIMREFYDRCDPASRPHVFGMTASPLNSKETASESVQNLQAVLDSRLCTVDLTARTDSLGSKQIHLCYEYRLSPEFPQTQLTMAIEEQCRGCQTIEPASKLVAYVLPSLGPYGVDQMWHHFIRQWHRRTLLRPATTDRPVNPPLNPPASLSCSPISTPAERPSSAFQQSARGSSDADQLSPDLSDVDRYFDARDAVQQQQYMDEYGCSDKDAVSENIEDISFLKQALTIDNMFGGKPYRNLDQLVGNQTDAVLIGTEKLTELDADHASDMHPTPLLRALSLYRKPWDQLRSQLSPQVNRLFGILYQWRDRPKDLRGIVFTSRRITAVLLVYIISQISEFSYIQSEVLLGGSSKQNSSIANRPIRGGSVRAANQAVLADFAKGRLNLIFATQVAEEGVDIQPCNLVIRFDMPDTATSLIQSRGRARMSGSQFIVMVPEIDAEQKASAATASTATAIADADAGQSSSSEISKTNPMVVTWESESDQESDAGHLNMALDKSSRSSSNRQKTYADYLRLVSLEECLREWCLVAATKHEGKDSGNVIISSRTHEEYGCRLRRMRMLLTIESSSYHLEATVQDEPWIERRDSTGRIYTIKSTNACITYLSASSIVQRYIQLLPQDDYFKLQLDVEYEQKTVEQPRPQENTAVQDGPSTTLRKKQPKPAFLTIYRCVLSLPSNAALRKVVGPYMPKKKLAKQAAVYRAAKKLHQLGAIDDNLIPACSVSSDINDVADEPELSAETAKTKGVRASVQEYSIAMPSAFISPLPRTDTAGSGYVPFAWHIYKIKLDHPLSTTCLELAIATAQSLPPDTAVPLYIDQYAKGKTDLDTTQSLICPMYIGKQTLEYAQ
ncbi:Dicer-like protein 1, partial [Coemansia asiatica]